MTVTAERKIEKITKSGLRFSVSFSDDTPDYSRLAKFFILLAQSPEVNSENIKTYVSN